MEVKAVQLKFPRNSIAGAVLAAAGLCASLAFAQTPEATDDDTFLLLREAARQDDAAKAHALASRLPHYVIPSYVEYYELKPRLKEAGAEEVRAYLKRHEGSAIADRMRNDWLLELGKKRDWANFDQQLPQFVLNDDTQVKCYALLSRVNKGHKVADEARALLVNPPVYGEACASLIAALKQSGQFDTRDLLAQLRLAGEFNATGPAKRAAALLDGPELRAAQAVDLPALVIARGVGKTRVEHEIYLIAVSRLARTSHKLAVAALEKAAKKLSAEEQAIGWSYLALYASKMLMPEAAAYWKKAAAAPLSYDAVQWRARVALRQSDWAQLKTAIQAMPARVRDESVWQYWQGRVLAHEGQHDAAAALFRAIANPNNYYGQLALEELGERIATPPQTTPPSSVDIARAASSPGLQRALKFFKMRLRFEGTREWNWELRRMGERELLAAAEFARQNDILDRMVYTSERTRNEHDYSQRFPTPHNDLLHPATQGLGLDRAWVYGLIRQESRFIMDARSSVGAAGLMQVMPSTAKYVARKIGLTEYGHDQLHDLRTNITLGANYLSMVLNSMDGSQTLATAAYNAGPSRARNWRASLSAPVEGPIFVETIPFPETRGYVKNVLANATLYAALFEGRPQSLKARLGSVGPRSTTASPQPDLPSNTAAQNAND